MEVDDYPLVSGDSGLPKPKQRNAVSFNEKPKFKKTKSIGPNKQQRSPEQLASKQSNDQEQFDVDDDDFPNASDDSDEYDGLPKTEEIPYLNEVKQNKIEIVLDRNPANCQDNDILDDVPMT